MHDGGLKSAKKWRCRLPVAGYLSYYQQDNTIQNNGQQPTAQATSSTNKNTPRHIIHTYVQHEHSSPQEGKPGIHQPLFITALRRQWEWCRERHGPQTPPKTPPQTTKGQGKQDHGIAASIHGSHLPDCHQLLCCIPCHRRKNSTEIESATQSYEPWFEECSLGQIGQIQQIPQNEI